MWQIRILVACEESQAVTIEMRKLGHEAYSCDIEPCSGRHPEWHIQQDVIPLLNGNCTFKTCDGMEHHIDGQWDMIIAFPPCTHLCVSGQHWFYRGLKNPQLREDGAKFFMAMVNADCEKIAIENPVGIMSTRYRKPDQTTHPWQFGHPEQKSTCLWLKGLPPLKATDNVHSEMMSLPKNKRERLHYLSPGPERAKQRSKTYPGIARAMANSWGGDIRNEQIDGVTTWR